MESAIFEPFRLFKIHTNRIADLTVLMGSYVQVLFPEGETLKLPVLKKLKIIAPKSN